MNVTSYPRTPRLVNRFMLGSDPEFVFEDKKGNYIYAETLGLTTMQGFGCDMAGRQAEIRAYPSRFALEVVASIVDSLRWMGYACPETLPLIWSAQAYNGKDGCGGHIHFGRKRPNRELEVKIMDFTTALLLEQGILNKNLFKARAYHKKDYGKPGDIRLNRHGFEYRTLPTALSTPWLTYFVLVVSKLMVYKGVLNSQKVNFKTLLEEYADIDDDAAIALKALNKWGYPQDTPDDFKGRWGVNPQPNPLHTVDNSNHLFFPSVIEAEHRTCEELFSCLTGELERMPQRLPTPTWSPYVLPKGFHSVKVQLHTLGHLPDVGMDLISSIPVLLELGDRFCIQSSFLLPQDRIKQTLGSVMPYLSFESRSGGIKIRVTSNFKNSREQCAMLRTVLSKMDLFPVCEAKNFSTTDWSKWDKPTAPVTKPLQGKLLARAEGRMARY